MCAPDSAVSREMAALCAPLPAVAYRAATARVWGEGKYAENPLCRTHLGRCTGCRGLIGC